MDRCQDLVLKEVRIKARCFGSRGYVYCPHALRSGLTAEAVGIRPHAERGNDKKNISRRGAETRCEEEEMISCAAP